MEHEQSLKLIKIQSVFESFSAKAAPKTFFKAYLPGSLIFVNNEDYPFLLLLFSCIFSSALDSTSSTETGSLGS